ncbi:glycosyltransferase [Carnobacterium maltaromaticum]|uniref:glycosyltransferase n=1 Tax=Carnobacterium maltaromaticum TaxID=2751 RepID=UPI0039BEA6A5
MDLIRESDVGLLPTRQDTYGFSVLEMQAASIPVITTDIRALPEINNNSCGWLISVPKNKNGESFYRNNSEASMLATEIRNGLSKVFTEILEDDGNIILDKGSAAFSRICKEHSVEKFSDKLDGIYNL